MKNKFKIFEGKKKFVYNLSSDPLIYRFELMLFFPLSTYLTSPLTPRPPPPLPIQLSGGSDVKTAWPIFPMSGHFSPPRWTASSADNI